jgi:glycosyltransferase involved in cell wall biosynthesis
MIRVRVLIWTPLARKVPGGHQVQLDLTAKALRSAGLDVVVSHDLQPSFVGYALVHGARLTADEVRRCRNAGAVVCVSTIYWSQRYTLGLDQRMGGGFDLQRRIRLAVVLAAAAARFRHAEKFEKLIGPQLEKRLAYESADLLLPNSELEAEAIRRELGVTTPQVVVPNGIDESLFGQQSAATETRDENVLYVGRFEPHKNQLGLIRALRDRPYRLILAGPSHPHHQKYYEQCLQEAGGNVEFVPERSQADLVALYQRARVHVVPSWYETTGLVSLEAAALRCNVVTTDRGFAREYFGDLAWYCDPANPQSITKAVDEAVHSPYKTALRERVLERFTWRAAAEATLRAYRQALAPRSVEGERAL